MNHPTIDIPYVELKSRYMNSTRLVTSSVKLYVGHIEKFYDWFYNHSGCSENVVSQSMVRSYQRYLESVGKSLSSISSSINALRSWFNFMIGERLLSTNPVNGIQVKRVEGFTKQPLMLNEVNTLLKSIDVCTVIGQRDYLIIAIQFLHGLRRCEVIRMNIDDIYLSHHGGFMLRIMGKGKTTREEHIPLDENITSLLKNYCMIRVNEHGAEANDPVFTSLAHYNLHGRISGGMVTMMTKRRLRSIGIDDPKITNHSLRHGCAINLMKQGLGEQEVQYQLRHKDQRTTRWYTYSIKNEMLLKNNMRVICNTSNQLFNN
jgi:site-specific recombinase XerD